MPKAIHILYFGDIIGKPGVRAAVSLCQKLKKQYKADFIGINGENAADGFGLTPEIAEQLFHAGYDVISTGNHIWQQAEMKPYLDQKEAILRPANYPNSVPGHGSCVIQTNGYSFGIINIQGRQRMWPIDDPFKKIRDEIKKLKTQCDALIVDIHADMVDEKEAIAYYIDGDVQVIFGTHTHIPTNDHRILPKGSAYISDLGACGPDNSIIGFEVDTSLERNLRQLPIKSEVSANPAILRGIYVELDSDSKKVQNFEIVNYKSLV